MPRWSVIIPVKPAIRGKSRLRGVTLGTEHEHLARALALDTISAVLACPVVARILVVTDDGPLRAALTGPTTPVSVRFAAEPVPGGLNAAVRHGESLLAPAPTRSAVLTSDLPALHPAELTAALRAASGHPRAFVADTPGTGTVLLTSTGLLEPLFGPHSAAAHENSGAIRLPGHWPALRRDVDTPADLSQAQSLGLGHYTTKALSPTPGAGNARAAALNGPLP